MGNFYETRARAKINISLDVLGKREDGYHDLIMIMQTVDFGDLVQLNRKGKEIRIVSGSSEIPSGSDNIAYKVAAAMFDYFGIKEGLEISIEKKIPVAAGLAGGSADAAAVIRGINEIFDLGSRDEELAAIGKTIGADVPYCIYGGTMLAEGIGEKLTRLIPFPDTHILIVKPDINVSTKWVYENLNLNNIRMRPDTDLLIKAIERKDIGFLAKNMKNVLETVTEIKYPIISEIKETMTDKGADGSMMSGSGPSVFGIFSDYSAGKACFDYFKSKNNFSAIYTKISG